MNTTLVFLKSYLSRNAFTEALAWIKSRSNRIFLPEEKIWVLDIEESPESPLFEEALDEVREEGWTIVGTTLWDSSIPLKGNEVALRSLAELTIEHRHRNPKS